MKIPKRFKLFARTINIVYNNDLFIDDLNYNGFAVYRKDEIHFRESPRRTEEQEQQTFWHELTHFILYHAGPSQNKKVEPHQDENFVDIIAQLLHQAIETMEFEED